MSPPPPNYDPTTSSSGRAEARVLHRRRWTGTIGPHRAASRRRVPERAHRHLGPLRAAQRRHLSAPSGTSGCLRARRRRRRQGRWLRRSHAAACGPDDAALLGLGEAALAAEPTHGVVPRDHAVEEEQAYGTLLVAGAPALAAVPNAVDVVGEGGDEKEDVEAEADVVLREVLRLLGDLGVRHRVLAGLSNGADEAPLNVEGKGRMDDGDADVGQAENHQLIALELACIGHRRSASSDDEGHHEPRPNNVRAQGILNDRRPTLRDGPGAVVAGLAATLAHPIEGLPDGLAAHARRLEDGTAALEDVDHPGGSKRNFLQRLG
mmetsp:Transcript_16723/g.34035  ORF Transcript_16723/g.34035 Transcript_16723/m.34035 type:complete len:321 (+) Transcript_16723:59-1021(+)